MKLLFIDDDIDLISIYQSLFNSRGHQFIGVQSAQEALSIVASTNDFDICITDYQLPDLIGPELICRLSQVIPESIFVLFTAHDRDFASMKLLKSPQVTVIQKPISFLELEQKLLEYLSHRERQGHTGS